MKKAFTLTLALLFVFAAGAQKQRTNFNAWKLGLNIGSTYQTSDITDLYGLGWGATFEKANFQNATHIFDLTWRFRYLRGTTYGQNYRRDYGIKNNTALNGTNVSSIDYANTVGYAFQNYKMKYDEVSFELLLGLNKLRERTGILMYGWGGIGFTAFQTYTDQLDAAGQMYNYASIDSAGSTANVKTQLSALYDKKYETRAEGNNSMNWRLTPSAGIGFGYQFGKNFSMAFEFKRSWPHTDVLDGNKWNVANVKTGDNDYYNYGGLHLLFTVGGKKTVTSGGGGSTPPVTTYEPAPVNPNPVVNPVTPVLPAIKFLNPASNPYKADIASANILARITNISSAGNIGVKINGMTFNGFAYNDQNKNVSFSTGLLAGRNLIELRATNNAGSAVETMVINYVPPGIPVGGKKPVVTIINPNVEPFVSSASSSNVTASVYNIFSRDEITVLVNGSLLSSFNYNESSKILSFTANLIKGNNTVTIVASNNNGSDSKTSTLVYSVNEPGKPEPVKPVITITYPDSDPFKTSVSKNVVNALVSNVVGQNNISVSVNGKPVIFTYDVNSKALVVETEFTEGNNLINISAFNNAGSAVKTLTLIYTKQTGNVLKPVINIVSPQVNPYTLNVGSGNVSATILNIESAASIAVTVNGLSFSGFNYNPSSKFFSAAINLKQGSNSIKITASNSGGSDSKTVTLIYSKEVPPVNPQPLKPTVTIVRPDANPFTSPAKSVNILAGIQNIKSASAISVLVNELPVQNFTYNENSKQLALDIELKEGLNKVQITATNEAGSDSKTQVINFTPEKEINKPEVMIISPAHNPDKSPTCFLNLVAAVKNVSSKEDISLVIDGKIISDFVYNASSQHVTYQTDLNGLVHKVLITAKNPAGSATADLTVNCTETKAVKPEKPVITITYPGENPLTVNIQTLTMTATVRNIGTAKDATVLVNNLKVENFTFNSQTKQVTIPVSLNEGANSITITATNIAGSDTKTQTIIYTKPVTPKKPEVTIISPAHNPDNSPTCFLNLVANITNAGSKNEISMTIDGKPVTGFEFNTSSNHLTYQGNLTGPSPHKVVINVNNAGGTASAELTVNCGRNTQPSLEQRPVVSITNPMVNPFNTSTAQANLTATVLNINSVTGITVTINGTVATGLNFNSASHVLSLPLTLVNGVNTVTINATNTAGTDNKSQTFIYTVPPIKPEIRIISPAHNPDNSPTCFLNLVALVRNVSKEQITLKIDGNVISNFDYNTSSEHLKYQANLTPGMAHKVIISAGNITGTESAELTVNCGNNGNNNNQGGKDSKGNTGGNAGTAIETKPKISVTSPTDHAVVPDSVVTVSGVITGVKEKSGVVIKVNGVTVGNFNFNPANNNFSAVISLRAGNNTVEVTANNSAGQEKATINIVWQGGKKNSDQGKKATGGRG